MKVAKVALFAVMAALVAVGLSTTAYSFHSGGVAECEGCHSMHSPSSSNFLLVGGDQSSTCLTCHEGPTLSSYHVSTTGAMSATVFPANMTPGGDFAWLKRTYTFGTSGVEEGRTHGHNIVAADFGYVADDNNLTAPGGSFVSNQLACNSCHDPHGKYRRLQSGAIARSGAAIKASGSYDNVSVNEPTATEAVGAYRLLAGNGYSNIASGIIGYLGVPAAKVPGTYNQSEATNQVRVAYGVSAAPGHTTWSNWCATCHPGMHSTGNTVHPVDRGLGSTIAGLYNQYVFSGNMTGTVANSFNSLAPFAQNTGDYTLLAANAKNNNSALGGPVSGDQVMCLSCHRAHASGFVEMLRFDQGYEFTTKGGQYVGSDNPEVTGSRAPNQHRGRTNSEWQRAYYERPAATTFASYQRVLCNKCHAQD